MACRDELNQIEECPEPTPTPWNAYYNIIEGSYTLSLPAGNIIQLEDGLRVNLAKAENTLLSEKYMELTTQEIQGTCKNTLTMDATQVQDVTLNGITFLKKTGTGAAAGNIYDYTSYTVRKDNICIFVTFVLHSSNPGVYDNPPPAFDKEQESIIFDQIINTFRFTN